LTFSGTRFRLKDLPLGPLPVFYTYENTYLFRAEKEAETYKEINPENIPVKEVKAGEIAVTNQAAKRYGMIGIKLIDDAKYGPTGEKFGCTNIIGKVIHPERLKGIKAGILFTSGRFHNGQITKMMVINLQKCFKRCCY